MMNKIFILLSCCIITGCATSKAIEVDIPIPVQAKPVQIEAMPYLPIDSLTTKSSDPTIIKAYVASVDLLKSWGQNNYDIAKAMN